VKILLIECLAAWPRRSHYCLALPSSARERSCRLTLTKPAPSPRRPNIYSFPLVDNYRVQYAYFVDKIIRLQSAPWNQLFDSLRVFTPEDRAIQTPNSTPNSPGIGSMASGKIDTRGYVRRAGPCIKDFEVLAYIPEWEMIPLQIGLRC
jgi:hypothetical protein